MLKMKMCKTITLFILLLTEICRYRRTRANKREKSDGRKHSKHKTPGYFCNNAGVTAGTTPSWLKSSPTSKVKQTPESEVTHESNDVSEKHLATELVAGISITFVLLFVVVIIGVWCARTKSKGSSAEITSGSSAEAGVSLKNMSAYENQSEWHFERA